MSPFEARTVVGDLGLSLFLAGRGTSAATVPLAATEDTPFVNIGHRYQAVSVREINIKRLAALAWVNCAKSLARTIRNSLNFQFASSLLAGKRKGLEVIAHESTFQLPYSQGRLVLAGRKVRDSLLRSRVRLRLEDQLDIQGFLDGHLLSIRDEAC